MENVLKCLELLSRVTNDQEKSDKVTKAKEKDTFKYDIINLWKQWHPY